MSSKGGFLSSNLAMCSFRHSPQCFIYNINILNISLEQWKFHRRFSCGFCISFLFLRPDIFVSQSPGRTHSIRFLFLVQSDLTFMAVMQRVVSKFSMLNIITGRNEFFTFLFYFFAQFSSISSISFLYHFTQSILVVPKLGPWRRFRGPQPMMNNYIFSIAK